MKKRRRSTSESQRPTSTSNLSCTIFESWRLREASRLSTNTKIAVFVERRHAVRGLICSWRMREGKSFLSCWSRLSTALRGALGTFCK